MPNCYSQGICGICKSNTFYLSSSGQCPTCAYESSPKFETKSADMIIENELRTSRKSKVYLVGTWTDGDGFVTTRMGICEEPYVYRTKGQRRGWNVPPPIDPQLKRVTHASMRRANRGGMFFSIGQRIAPTHRCAPPVQKPETLKPETVIEF